MKKSKDFFSFIDSIKDEIDNLKQDIQSMQEYSDPNSNVLMESTSIKNYKNFKKKSNKYNKNFELNDNLFSSEGKSLMTNSIEGVGYEGTSYEGKSIMTTSMEEKSQMSTFNKINNNDYDHELNEINTEYDSIKNNNSLINNKEDLKKAVLFLEVIGIPKSLK